MSKHEERIDGAEELWFAVRIVIAYGRYLKPDAETYEERITLWRTLSSDLAIAAAIAQAKESIDYLDDEPGVFVIQFAQSFQINEARGQEALASGTEAFSLMRVSSLSPQNYVDRFFDTGTERFSVRKEF